MKRKPIISNLIVAIILPLLVMVASVFICYLCSKSVDSINTKDFPMILSLCSLCIFFVYCSVMWYVGRSFDGEIIIWGIIGCIVAFRFALKEGYLDLGTSIIAIFVQIIIMRLISFSTFPISIPQIEDSKEQEKDF